MARKFKFNHETLDFDLVRRSTLSVLRKGALWTFAAATFLTGYYIVFSRFFSTPEEKRLTATYHTLTNNYEQLCDRYDDLQKVVDNMTNRDVNIYRRVFESDPPCLNTSEVLLSTSDVEHANISSLTKQTKKGINDLSKIVEQQTAYLQQITSIAKSITAPQNLPSIQPVRNPDLQRTAATYGMRIHPFYKLLKMHSGVDFTAPLGDKLFATGAGRVESVQSDMRHTGTTLTINHGNGYRTIYGHLLQANVNAGDYVKRGKVIGLVGSSGRSVAPHLHYEVEKNGHTVNPLHYFFQELTPDEYQQMTTLAGNKGQPLD